MSFSVSVENASERYAVKENFEFVFDLFSTMTTPTKSKNKTNNVHRKQENLFWRLLVPGRLMSAILLSSVGYQCGSGSFFSTFSFKPEEGLSGYLFHGHGPICDIVF